MRTYPECSWNLGALEPGKLYQLDFFSRDLVEIKGIEVSCIVLCRTIKIDMG